MLRCYSMNSKLINYMDNTRVKSIDGPISFAQCSRLFNDEKWNLLCFINYLIYFMEINSLMIFFVYYLKPEITQLSEYWNLILFSLITYWSSLDFFFELSFFALVVGFPFQFGNYTQSIYTSGRLTQFSMHYYMDKRKTQHLIALRDFGFRVIIKFQAFQDIQLYGFVLLI